MLKPDDPAWAELVAEIKAVVSSRGNDGYAFSSLHRCEQWDFFKCSGFYHDHMEQGITETQLTIILRNALDGKPQEKWFDGVFDREAETPTLADILEGNMEHRAVQSLTQERGGRKM